MNNIVLSPINIRNHMVSSVFVFLFFVFLSVGTFANEQPALKDVPNFDVLSQKKFEETTELIKEEPQGDKYLDFTLRLPENWKRDEDQITLKTEYDYLSDYYEGTNSGEGDEQLKEARVLGPVVSYYSPAILGLQSRLEVVAEELEHNMSLRSWMFRYLYNRGYTIQGLTQHSQREIEALYVVVRQDIPYYVRTKAQVNGRRMVLVSYYLPEPSWEKEKAMQQKVIDSFSFLHPKNIRIVSSLTYSFLDILTIEYPAGWRLSAPRIDSIDEMEVEFVNSEDQELIDGEMKFLMVKKSENVDLAERIESLKQHISRRGLNTGELIEQVDLKFYELPEFLDYAAIEVYQAKPYRRNLVSDYELWLGLFFDDEYYYFLTMLTPERGNSFRQWTENSEAFKLVIETMKK